MSQLTAGENVTFTVDGITVTAKVEDASKGDVFSAKIQSCSSQERYSVDGVYEFDRNVLA